MGDFKMRSFANLKRTLNEGVYLTMIQHDLMPNNKLIGLKRKIIKRKSNAIQLEGGSWLYFDKPASHFQYTCFNEFKVLLNPDSMDSKYMVYRIGYNHE